MSYRTITAKWGSICPECEEPIEEGETVLWKKGEKAIHPGCQSGGQMRPAAKKEKPAALIVSRDKARARLKEVEEYLRDAIPDSEPAKKDAVDVIRTLWVAAGDADSEEKIEDLRKIAEVIGRLVQLTKRTS